MSDLSAAVEWLEKDYDETMRLELGQPWNGVRSIWAAGGPGGIPRPFFSIKGDDSEPQMTCFGSDEIPDRPHP